MSWVLASRITKTSPLPYAILAPNPDHALWEGLLWLGSAGSVQPSRNGDALVSPVPVTTVYPDPVSRVSLNPLRDANPFFHLFEALWMLAGRNDVAKVANYAKQMEAFADDGLLWGAYGFRWRKFFGFDQLAEIVTMLQQSRSTRRAVIAMWSPLGDLVEQSDQGGPAAKDVPCNTHIYFDATSGRLNMTVCNRSNDAVWGAYGANVVHMSVLHEFVALAARIPLGVYYQASNNFHVYPDRPDVQKLLKRSTDYDAHWELRRELNQRPTPEPGRSALDVTQSNWEQWLEDCEAFVTNPTADTMSPGFLNTVARPMMEAHLLHKEGQTLNAAGLLRAHFRQTQKDWHLAGALWLERRLEAQRKKEQA